MKLHNNNMNQRDIIDLVDQLFEIDRSKRSIIVGAVDGHNHVSQIRIRDVLKVAAGGCLRSGEYPRIASLKFCHALVYGRVGLRLTASRYNPGN